MSNCITHKQTYPSMEDARDDLRRLRRQRDADLRRERDPRRRRSIEDRPVWQRAYECNLCDGFHLTHKDELAHGETVVPGPKPRARGYDPRAEWEYTEPTEKEMAS